MDEAHKPWFDVRRLSREKHKTKLSIAFAFVATHNHFVLDRGGKVFNRSAPIIKLPEGATEDDHLTLLAYLNSSTACFWMKQVFHNKGGGTDSGGWQAEQAKGRYEFTGTGLEQLPIPDLDGVRGKLCDAARTLLQLASEREALIGVAVQGVMNGDSIENGVDEDRRLLEAMVTLQEEIDWMVYGAFALVHAEPPPDTSWLSKRTPLGCRPFEIALAAHGESTSIDGHAMADSAALVSDVALRSRVTSRVSTLENVDEIRLIEAAQYKRRWVTTPKNLAGRGLRFEDRVRSTGIRASSTSCSIPSRTELQGSFRDT